MIKKIFARHQKHKIHRALLSISGKGGVGKSLVAASLANLFVKTYQQQVGLLDCDIRAPNIPAILNIPTQIEFFERNENRQIKAFPYNGFRVFSTSLYISRGDRAIELPGEEVRENIKQSINDVDWGETLDVLVADMPPATGDALIAMREIFKKKLYAIIISSSDISSIRDCRRVIHSCVHHDIPILGVIGNLVGSECPNCHNEIFCKNCNEEISFGNPNRVKKMAESLHCQYLGYIPFNPAIKQQMDNGNPFVDTPVMHKIIQMFLEK